MPPYLMSNAADQATSVTRLLDFIEPLEAGQLKDASSIYISTGECPPAARDLQGKLRNSGLPLRDFDWLAWVAEARPYLQSPETLENASLDDVRKLVTVAVHSDMFNKSLFPHLCSSGFMQHLLLRIRALHSA